MDADAVLGEWLDRSGEFSPAYYAYYGPDERSEAVHAHLDPLLDPGASVLEVGCSSGRHLSYLHDRSRWDLTGVDINEDAFDVMEDAYPDLAAAGTFHAGAIEDVVAGFDDGAFDAVYSVETLQHIHPDNEWVFEEIARVTGDALVTVEIEGDHGGPDPDVNYVDGQFPLYYRDWSHVFSACGLVEVASEPTGRTTLRTFRHEGH